jgi:hypothetical protein
MLSKETEQIRRWTYNVKNKPKSQEPSYLTNERRWDSMMTAKETVNMGCYILHPVSLTKRRVRVHIVWPQVPGPDSARRGEARQPGPTASGRQHEAPGM